MESFRNAGVWTFHVLVVTTFHLSDMFGFAVVFTRRYRVGSTLVPCTDAISLIIVFISFLWPWLYMIRAEGM